MAADFKTKYPSTSSVTITISLASLASSSTLLAGQESTSVDNTTNLDEDHIISGVVMVGTTPTANTRIEVWAVAPRSIASGTPTWPDVFDGTDSAETITNAGVKSGVCKLVASIPVPAATSNVGYEFNGGSIADLFGRMPPFYVLFVTHNTGVALNATGGNHVIHYERVQSQSV